MTGKLIEFPAGGRKQESAQGPQLEIDLDRFFELPLDEQLAEARRLAQWKGVVEGNPLWRYFPHEGEKGWKIAEQQKVIERWLAEGAVLLPDAVDGVGRGTQLHARFPDGIVLGMPLELQLDGNEQRGQMAFHEIDLYEGAYVGGNRSGKTHGGAAHMLIQTLPPELVPPWLLPYRQRDEEREFFGRVVGVDLAYWLDKAIIPKLRKLIPPAALWHGSWEKAWNERKRTLYFERGDWWDFLTHDMDIDSFASAELDYIWLDEEPPGEKGKQQFEECEMRLIDRGGRLRVTMTPLFGMSWLYYELTDDQGNPRDDEDCRVVQGDIDHNPHLSPAHRTRALRRMAKDPLKLAARKSGHWVHFAGMVYGDEWDERRHVVPDRDPPRAHEGAKPSVPMIEMIDPGIATDHPAALSIGFLTPEDEFEIFHTHRIYGGTAEDMCKHIHEQRAAFGYKPRFSVIDPSARNKHHATGRSTQQEYAKHKVFTIPGQNDVEAGINAVKERLKSDRLRVQQRCAEFLDEIPNYRWKGNKRSRSEDSAKPQVVKRHDDIMDTVRYGVMQLPRAPRRPPEPEEERSPAQQAFKDNLKRIARRGSRRRRGRVGGYV